MGRPKKVISEFDRKLGVAIKNRRTDPEYGMSQARLSEATGIALSNLQRREDGENDVTVSELERIAVALQTTPLELVEDALRRYGGREKLIAEFTSTSEGAATVTAEDNVSYLDRHPMPKKFAAKKKREED